LIFDILTVTAGNHKKKKAAGDPPNILYDS
jgi:hypothetical protein